ncbi:MAG: DUF305 domain-containing protein [Microcella sp.]
MTASGTPDTVSATGAAATPRVRLLLGAAVLVLIALVAGVLLGRITAPSAGGPIPSNTSAEAGFSRDMQTHHTQAVEMALLVRDRSDSDEIRLLALDMATAQMQQIGQMAAWLQLWGLPAAPPEPSMTWMTRPALDGGSHESHDGVAQHSHTPGEPMPGLATPEQMQQLRAADGLEAEVLFLELMIAHHQGGVEMAAAVIERSEHPVVLDLAGGMVRVQQSELDYMTELLEARR